MKITHLLSAVALTIFTISVIVPTAKAAGDVVTVKHAPTKFAGRPNCASKYPAGGGQAGAFRHGLTKSCYSCPAGFKRSLNPNIKAADACVRTTAARSAWSKAAYKGKKTVSKPTKRAFKDPRRGGEWWECPSNRPRRTAYAVTDKRACATKNILGEKLARAKFLSKVTRSTPKGAFFDPRRGGEFWACPAGYKRTVFPVTTAKACEKVTAASTKRAKAKSRGAFGCKAGAFQNGLENACYTCPASYKRSAIPGTNLHKMKNACVNVKVVMPKLENPEFLRWAEVESKKIRKQFKPAIDQALATVTRLNNRKIRDRLKKAKSRTEQRKIARQLMNPLIAWTKKTGGLSKRASLRRHLENSHATALPAGSGGTPFRVASAASDFGPRLTDLPALERGPTRSFMKVATKKDEGGIKTVSLGFTGDASFMFGGTFTPIMWGWDVTPKNEGLKEGQPYLSFAYAVGATAGVDLAPELGFWTDINTKLGGNTQGFTVAAAYKGGLGMTFWWSVTPSAAGKKERFIGFTIVPQVGIGAEIEYTRGTTVDYR